jgi:hypothetical protein
MERNRENGFPMVENWRTIASRELHLTPAISTHN